MNKILSWLLLLTLVTSLTFSSVITVSAAGESGNYTDEQLAAHDYTLYYVDCGDATTSTADPGDKIGLYQSVTDKAYGEDTTGFSINAPGPNPSPFRRKALSIDKERCCHIR